MIDRWFSKMCRNAGLAIHHVANPTEKKTVRHTTEEKQISPTVTLRRTTIEEIEVKKNGIQ